ncbi:MAG: pantetheine-phosphate adenylyltransferase, partial [Proteobacteria bacterium]
VDFEYEMTMANMNKMLAPDIETMLVFADPRYYFISSRGVKEVAQHHGSLSGLVPDLVAEALQKKLRRS